MLPTINEFISKYGLENFVVVADSGLMNNADIAELEASWLQVYNRCEDKE